MFTAGRAEGVHNRAVELIQSRLLEEGGRECPKSLAPPLVLPPQEVHEFRIDVGIHLLEMSVSVADAEVLSPAAKNRVQRPDFLFEAVEVVVPHRIADLVSDAAHRFRRRPAIAEKSFRVAAHRPQPKVRPEKIKPVGGVDDARLFRTQGQTQAPDDVLQPLKPRLWISPAKNHQVITVANQFRSAHPRLPFDIESMQIRVRDQRRNYAPMQGVPALCEAIGAKFQDLYGARYDPESEITVTSGGTEAIFDAIAATVRPGDEVIVFEPCYDSYVPAIQLNGGVAVVSTLRFPDYTIDWADVRRAVTPRTRLMVLNSPHNPAGSILTADDIRQLAAIVEGTNILVLSDEVYEHIIFDGLRHESLARHPELAARSFIVGSFGKMYHTTGWKIGYAAAPAPLTAEFRKVHQYVTFATNTPIQHAFAEFLSRKAGYGELAAFYQAKRDRFLELTRGSRFRPLRCAGSYFILLDYATITDEDDMTFAVRLTKEHGVASIPTSAFLYKNRQAPSVLRFCFAKKDETLERAAERLCRV